MDDNQVDVQAPVADLLDRLTRLMQDARSMPMSASCVVNRAEVLELLAELRRQLPQALTQASALLDERDGVVAAGRAEAERLVEQARQECVHLVSETEVHKAAVAEAERLLEDARKESDATRLEVEDYVDGKLANFEIVLSKTLAAVQRGRARLHGESELDNLDEEDDSRPLPG